MHEHIRGMLVKILIHYIAFYKKSKSNIIVKNPHSIKIKMGKIFIKMGDFYCIVKIFILNPTASLWRKEYCFD